MPPCIGAYPTCSGHSVSVNSFSDSFENIAAGEMVTAGVPPSLHPAAGLAPAVRIRLLARWLRCTVSAVRAGSGSSNDEASGVGNAMDAAAAAATFLVPWVESRLGGLFRALACDQWDASRCPRLGRLPPPLDQEVVAHATKVAARLSDGLSSAPGLRAHHANISDLILISWVERIARHIVGEERLCPFLRCLSTPTSWDVELQESERKHVLENES